MSGTPGLSITTSTGLPKGKGLSAVTTSGQGFGSGGNATGLQTK